MVEIMESRFQSISFFQYETALNTCDPQTLLRIGTLYPEMSVHEKSVDFYIELLRKDQVRGGEQDVREVFVSSCPRRTMTFGLLII